MAVSPRFTNKVALITGAATGIGGTTAEGLAREGAKVVVSDIDEAAGKAKVKKIQDAGGEAYFVRGDTTDAKSIEAMVAETVKKYGRIDYLVNNAGGGPVEYDGIEMSLDDWNFILNFNLTGPWYTTVHAVREMKKTGGGAIVNLSSMGAIRQTKHHNMAYAVGKAAIIRLTEMAAYRLGKDGIRVNCVAPGLTLTETAAAYVGEDQIKGMGLDEMTVIPRFAKPEEQAAAILYLLSDEAAYVTGQTIRVDGGWYTK